MGRIPKVMVWGDRTIQVPVGKVVRTGYVETHKVRLDNTTPVAIGDVQEKYEVVKQNSPNAVFPAPMGEWRGDEFWIEDGRHTYFAYLLNGYTNILVMWLDDYQEVDRLLTTTSIHVSASDTRSVMDRINNAFRLEPGMLYGDSRSAVMKGFDGDLQPVY